VAAITVQSAEADGRCDEARRRLFEDGRSRSAVYYLPKR
jgi:hypothetical protein